MNGLVDAHCHLNSERLADSPAETLRAAHAAGVADIVMAGTEPDCWRSQSRLAREHDHVWPVYGVHPWCAGELTGAQLDDALTELERCLRDEARPVAIGESGLDGSHLAPPDTLEAQETSLREHIALARRHDLPLVLHILKAHDDALRVLKDAGVPEAGAVVHSFSGSAELARQYQKLGLHISFCGSVSYPQSRRLRAAAAAVDAERLLAETDSPDQTPHPHRGEANRPALLPLIVRALAEARDEAPDAVAELTAANARRVFRLPAGPA